MKCSVFIATSLDGFIARANGEIDWLMKANELAPKGEDCGYKAFISSVDVLIMGRKSYEVVSQFEPWPYGELPVIVMTHSGVQIPSALQDTVSQTSESPKQLCDRLHDEGFQHAYVDGGSVIQSFIKEHLMDELTITVAPILIGNGVSLFGPIGSDLNLKLIASYGYEFGFVQSKYEIIKEKTS